MKSRAWYAKFPLDAYALGPFRFREPVSRAEARRHIRDWEYGAGKGPARLPNRVRVWPTNR